MFGNIGIFSRWLQLKDLKNEIQHFSTMSGDGGLLYAYHSTADKILELYGVDTDKILQGCEFSPSPSSTRFMFISHGEFEYILAKISREFRPSLVNAVMKTSNLSKDDLEKKMYYAGSTIVIHSLRGIRDYELNKNERLLNVCKEMWQIVSENNVEYIPRIFR
jgi:hypothetical protein